MIANLRFSESTFYMQSPVLGLLAIDCCRTTTVSLAPLQVDRSSDTALLDLVFFTSSLSMRTWRIIVRSFILDLQPRPACHETTLVA